MQLILPDASNPLTQNGPSNVVDESCPDTPPSNIDDGDDASQEAVSIDAADIHRDASPRLPLNGPSNIPEDSCLDEKLPKQCDSVQSDSFEAFNLVDASTLALMSEVCFADASLIIPLLAEVCETNFSVSRPRQRLRGLSLTRRDLD